MSRVAAGFCCAFVVVIAVAGCTPPPRSFGPCSVRAGGEREQQESLAPIPVTVAYFLDVDAGGPLTCRPGAGDACARCVGDVVSLPSDEQSTLAIAVLSDNGGFGPFAVSDVVVSAPGHESEVVLLAPLPTTGPATDLFIGITPTSTDTVVAEVRVTSDADNQLDNGDGTYPITLRYAGVDGDG